MPNAAAPRPLENGIPRASRLRNVAAARGFNEHLDSSESFPSEHASLCNAILLSFESDCDGCDRFHQQDVALDKSSLQVVREKAIAAPSPTKKRISPVIGARQAALFDGTNERPIPLTVSSTSNLTESYNPYPDLRVFSFDDLDIPARPRPRFRAPLHPTADHHHHRSSSSSGSFETLSWLNEVTSPAEPTLPIHPPLVRSPTPPGVPSFGTPEAINYDISTRSRRKNRRSAEAGGDGPTGSRRGSARSIRRFLGMSTPSGPPPPPLPPGAIARAEDGTYIRGRFGNRQSGHGVGGGRQSRGLECHPFHNSPVAAVPTTERPNRAGGPGNPSSRAQWRPPPYSSMLDVPVPPIEKPSRRRVRFANDPEHAGPSSATGAVREDATQRSPGTSQPRTPERAASNRRADAYSSPLTMQMNTDGQGDDPSSQDAADPGRWERVRSNLFTWCCSDERNEQEEARPTADSNDNSRATGVVNDTRSDHSTPSSRNSVNDKLLSLRRRYTSFFSTAWIPAWGWQPCPGS